MRGRVWTAISLLVLGAGTMGLGTAALSQGRPMPGSNATPVGGVGADQPGMAAQAPAQVEAGPLKIVFGDKSAEWTPAMLAALPHTAVTVYNSHAKANQTYSGVPLIDLLTRLGVPEKPHGKELRLYLVAEGSDGYMAVYSVAEVNPDVHDATVMVADTLDGKPVAESGTFQLVATREKRPARWVRNLVAIRVMTAQ